MADDEAVVRRGEKEVEPEGGGDTRDKAGAHDFRPTATATITTTRMRPAAALANDPRKGTRIAATARGATTSESEHHSLAMLLEKRQHRGPLSLVTPSLFKRREPFVQLQDVDVLGTEETPLGGVGLAQR